MVRRATSSDDGFSRLPIVSLKNGCRLYRCNAKIISGGCKSLRIHQNCLCRERSHNQHINASRGPSLYRHATDHERGAGLLFH